MNLELKLDLSEDEINEVRHLLIRGRNCGAPSIKTLRELDKFNSEFLDYI